MYLLPQQNHNSSYIFIKVEEKAENDNYIEPFLGSNLVQITTLLVEQRLVYHLCHR